jgi:hypothetical protein
MFYNSGGNSNHGIPSTGDVQRAINVPSNVIRSRKFNERTCVVTIAPWGSYQSVFALYDTLVESNRGIAECFAWYVADTPEPRGTSDKVAVDVIQKKAIALFRNLITLDRLLEPTTTTSSPGDGHGNASESEYSSLKRALYQLAFIRDARDLAHFMKPLVFSHA